MTTWERDGFVVAPSCVGADLVAAVDRALGDRPGLIPCAVAVDPVVLALCRAPGLVAAARSVLGDGVRILSACFIAKPARSEVRARWHQDGGSWPLDPLAAATVWLALDEVGPTSGGIEVVPGSHLAGAQSHGQDGWSLFGTGLVGEPDGPGRSIVLGAGDASVHHPLLVHRSGANRTAQRRAAFVVRYVAAGVVLTTPGWPDLLPT